MFNEKDKVKEKKLKQYRTKDIMPFVDETEEKHLIIKDTIRVTIRGAIWNSSTVVYGLMSNRHDNSCGARILFPSLFVNKESNELNHILKIHGVTYDPRIPTPVPCKSTYIIIIFYYRFIISPF